jgi:prevent-host-death family protein
MTYSVQEVEAHIGEILRRVREGERIVVADEGREVAEIRPLSAFQEARFSESRPEGSFSQRWRGQFQPADRKDERYRTLAKRYL